MISVSTVNDVLKTFYLDVLISQLNGAASPLYKKFKTVETFVSGREIVKPVCAELSSGVAALDEYEDLPTAESNKYTVLHSQLKNLYGTIQITDKAMRIGENTEGAVVNLLNAEMEGLIASAKQNFSRMLYGDGSATVAHVTQAASESTSVKVNNTRFIKPGMGLTFTSGDTTVTGTVASVGTDTVVLSAAVSIANGASVQITNLIGKEIEGIETIFNDPATLYGVTTSGKAWMKPYTGTSTGDISDIKIQRAIDTAEEASGGKIDFITCSYGVRRAYQNYLETTKRTINPVELEGGYKTISYAGIPVVADRFCPENTMYLLDSTLFELHQLCDWSWLEGDNGNVLKQMPGKAAYSATLVKYANLICSLPCGQAKLSGVTEK